MSKFKKLAVASAVAALGSSSAFAVTMGEPGAALLVPFAYFNSAEQVNTLVGITKLSTAQVGLAGDTGTPFPTAATVAPGSSNVIHWFFFNEESEHQLDGPLDVTSQGFVGFDLGAQITIADGGVGGAHDDLPGYLVFADNVAFETGGGSASTVNLYGDAAVITGNWGSAAYIPVLPLADTPDVAEAISPIDHVVYLPSGIPSQVSPWTAGLQLDNAGSTATSVSFNMRYFVEDLGLGGAAETDLVVWLPENYSGYGLVPVNVYDTDQAPNSANISLPNELNVVAASSIPWVTSKGAGHVEVTLAVGGAGEAGVAPAFEAGAAFSLVYFGQSASDGVQTILAHERGVIVP